MQKPLFRQQCMIVILLLIFLQLIAAFSPYLVAQGLIVVNGLTGKISPAIDSKQLIYYPGDIITIRIDRANLLCYTYQVVLTSGQKLEQSYSIVGIGVVKQSKEGEAPAKGFSVQALNPTVTLDDVGKLVRGLWEHEDALTNFYRNPSFIFANDISWSESLRNEMTRWSLFSDSFRSKSRDLSGQLDALYAQNLSTANTKKGTDSTKARGLMVKLDSARANMSRATHNFKAMDAILMRWSGILAEYASPVLDQSFRVDNESKRYIVQVKRVRVNEAQLLDLGVELETIRDTITIATIPFEGHQKSRINLSIGFSVIYRPDNYSYGFVGTPKSDSMLTYTVQRTGDSQVALKPLVMIGVYFGSVDDFDLRRPECSIRNFMFMVGTELNLPINTLVVGLGYDFPIGLVLSGGATIYNKVVPASGWSEGQQVTLRNLANVSSILPTESRSELGYYFSIGFRPSIFEALYGLIKPSASK